MSAHQTTADFQSKNSAFSVRARASDGEIFCDDSLSARNLSICHTNSEDSGSSSLPPPSPASASAPALPSSPSERFDPFSEHFQGSPNACAMETATRKPMPHDLSLTAAFEEGSRAIKVQPVDSDYAVKREGSLRRLTRFMTPRQRKYKKFLEDARVV